MPQAERKQWQDHRGMVIDSVKGFSVIECETCLFKHIAPIPTVEELESVYRDEYYTVEKPLYLDRVQEDLEWWYLVYRGRYDTFEKELPPDRRRILDVGSGPGYFLLYGKERGWQTLGFEPSAQAANHSRNLGLEVVESFVSRSTALPKADFDVVHMSEVLEHVPDPGDMVSLSYDLLAPGGLLCVVVPNDYNPFQYALRAVRGYSPWWVAPPHHINYFDFDSLRRLFERTGFEVVSKEATFPIDIFLLMGDNYVGDDVLGRKCHAKRKLLEHTLAAAGLNGVMRKFYQALGECGLGREVVLVGRKTDQGGRTS